MPWMCPTQWKIEDAGSQDSTSSAEVHPEEGMQLKARSRTPSPTEEELMEMFNGGLDRNNVDKKDNDDRDKAGLSMGMDMEVGAKSGMADATKLQETAMAAHDDDDRDDLTLSQRKICLENTARAPYRNPRVPASSKCSRQAELYQDISSRFPEIKHKAKKHVTWCSRLEVVHFFVGGLKHEAKRVQPPKFKQMKRTTNLPKHSTRTYFGVPFVPLTHNAQVGMLNSIKKRPKFVGCS